MAVPPRDLPLDRRSYVRALLAGFSRLPDALPRSRRRDIRFAERLYEQGVSLAVVYVAFVLVTARRSVPHHILSGLTDHPPIFSLWYFRAAIDEVRSDPSLIEPSYLGYLVYRNARYGRALPRTDQLFNSSPQPQLASRSKASPTFTQLSLPL